MNASEYQVAAARTLIKSLGFEVSDADVMLIGNALGLAGEAGEVANTVKKSILHQHGLDRDQLRDELGDCLWYLAALCTLLDLDLGEVMAANIKKLEIRYPHGFRAEDSIKRVDVEVA
jgi:NTP pyrophosphatase (non-canonical NTP hydrolase)